MNCTIHEGCRRLIVCHRWYAWLLHSRGCACANCKAQRAKTPCQFFECAAWRVSLLGRLPRLALMEEKNAEIK